MADDNAEPDWVEPNPNERTQASQQRDHLAEWMFCDFVYAPAALRHV
jgi:hypothetical protein